MPTITASDGVAIHYEEAGSGDPVVFLHGLGSSTKDWVPQLEHFARTHRAIAIDVRGHGASATPAGPTSVARLAADVDDVLRALDAIPAHLVGISMGGMFAFQLAVDSPDIVRSMTIVNSGPVAVPPGLKGWLFLQVRRWMARRLTPAQMADKLTPRLFPNPEHAALREEFRARFVTNDRDAYRETLEALARWSGLVEHLPRIDTPALFVSSDQDYTPPATKRPFVEAMPNARLEVIPDAHHAVTLERPAALNAVLERFLKEV